MKLSALLVTLSSIAAFAEEAAPEQQPSAIGSFLPLILLFVVMWLFFIRPKNKEMKKMEEMRKALKKGRRHYRYRHQHRRNRHHDLCAHGFYHHYRF